MGWKKIRLRYALIQNRGSWRRGIFWNKPFNKKESVRKQTNQNKKNILINSSLFRLGNQNNSIIEDLNKHSFQTKQTRLLVELLATNQMAEKVAIAGDIP